MAEFKLERFKYNWKGMTFISYNPDDVVNVGGKTYVFDYPTASADFNTDLLATVIGSDPIQNGY